MDALMLLHDDHREVDALFRKFAGAGPRAFAAKREIVDRIIRELSIHAGIEEQVFYPAIRLAVPAVAGQVLESLEEHHLVKWELVELERIPPEDERFDAKVAVLEELVRHHVVEEENDVFPKVRRELTQSRRAELGERLERAKSTVPDRPHPRLPDEPPANVLAGVAAGVVDAAKSTAGHLVEQVSQVVADVPDQAEAVERQVKRTARKATRKASATTTRARKSTKKAAKKATRTTTTTARGAAKKAKAVSRTTRKAGREAAGTARTARKATKKAATQTGARARAGATRTRKTAKRASASSR
jgi:hemerythrin superfamily protein